MSKWVSSKCEKDGCDNTFDVRIYNALASRYCKECRG